MRQAGSPASLEFPLRESRSPSGRIELTFRAEDLSTLRIESGQPIQPAAPIRLAFSYLWPQAVPLSTLQYQVLRRSMKYLLALAALASMARAQDFDVLIANGRIVDGTGNPSYIGDVGIRNGKIAALGRLSGRTATRTIDATGLTVAPGFVDIHNHSDYTLVEDGDAESMVRQGVTSMIFGEGGSAAPVGGKQDRGVGRADWSDLHGYFSRLLRQGISTNIGTYVGSSQIWTYVRGEKAGPVTAAELTEMRNHVRVAMEQGALGVASSLSGPPGSWIDTDTLVAMCEVASPYGGIYSTHM